MNRSWLWAALACAALLPTVPALAEGDAQAGQAKAATCAACHGPDGNSINPEWPSLAGQGAAYMVAQLKRFKSGERSNLLMAPQAALLSEQDMWDVSAWFAAQTPKVGQAQAEPKALALGERIYRGGVLEREIPACISCHGPRGAGNEPAQFPRLAGQQPVYTMMQLRAYREGFELHTRQNPMMEDIAARMTDPEIDAVAHYLSGLY